MKSLLELEIAGKIKKANELYSEGCFQKAVEAYDLALTTYCQNRSYNEAVSPHFESTIYSLRGLAYLSVKNFEQAEASLNYSLKLSPHNSISMIRRSKLHIETNLISQAIQDLGNALLYHPQSKDALHLVFEIQGKIANLTDSDQKQRLFVYLRSIRNSPNAQEEDIEQEVALKFSSLRKIDRFSATDIKTEVDSVRKKSKKISLFLEPKDGSLNSEGQSSFKKQASCDQSQSEDSSEHQPIIIIEKNKTGIKKKKINSESLKFQGSIADLIDQSAPRANFVSMDSIDSKKSQKVSSIRFIEKPEVINQGNQNRNNCKERKSILRSSKLVSQQQISTHVMRRTSSFLNIKNIDGPIIQSNCNHETNLQLSENVEGKQTVLQSLQNLSGLGKNDQPVFQKEKTNRKKDSILKIGSMRGLQSNQSQKNVKKSVCFEPNKFPAIL